MVAKAAPFRPLTPPRNLTAELIAVLRAEITGGKLSPGARLPTEQEMVASFGVSRTVVREAIAALRSDGLVLTRQGVGAFVAADTQSRPFRIDNAALTSLRDILCIMELRMGVEVETAGLAAERRSPRQLLAIKAALAQIDTAIGRGDAAIAADFEFHRAIAEATENPWFPKFLQYLGHYIIPRQTVRIEDRGSAEQMAYSQKFQEEHRRICAAIDAKDPAAAREAMRLHLTNSIGRYRGFAEALASKGKRKPRGRSR
jgi:GntR family transcriptional repressor for pyruvate dehydrogenase complex